MVAMQIVLWLGVAVAAILGIALGRRAWFAGHDPLAGFEIGPGDIDAAHYLASGRIAWASLRARRPGGSNRRRA